MKTIKITTPENIEVEYTLADIASRAAAGVIDMAIQGIFLVLLAIAILLISYNAPQFWKNYYGWIIGISLLLAVIFGYGYFIIMELSMNGATLGKKVMKLRAIRNNGQPITLKHSAIRNLFRLFIDVYGIGAVMIFFTKECRRLGDYAASTIVIAQNERTMPVTLESLQTRNKYFNYYISVEEQELLMDYISRRNTFKNCDKLREELKLHFTQKFESLGILNEWESFIDEL